jgi:hypothetical protein
VAIDPRLEILAGLARVGWSALRSRSSAGEQGGRAIHDPIDMYVGEYREMMAEIRNRHSAQFTILTIGATTLSAAITLAALILGRQGVTSLDPILYLLLPVPLLGLTIALLENDAMIAMVGLYVEARLAPKIRAIYGESDILGWEEFYRAERSGHWLMAIGRYSLTGVPALVLMGAYVLQRVPISEMRPLEWLMVVLVAFQLVVIIFAAIKGKRLRGRRA